MEQIHIKKHILIVEDDPAIAESISIYLKSAGFSTDKAEHGRIALEKIGRDDFDLVLMDVMMPVMDGIEAVQELRKFSVIPVIMLTAKSEDVDKILGLNMGADDYVTKPFNPMELIARVNSALRRATRYSKNSEPEGNILSVNDVSLNLDTKELFVLDRPVKMTPLELKIMTLLLEHPGRVFSIDEIYERVWNEPAINPETVTVHIRRIREKIEIDPKNPQYIKVVWGIGYKFEKGGHHE